MSLLEQEANPPILVYYRFRGQMQPIRNILCYLQAEFYQCFIQQFQQQQIKMPVWVLKRLKESRIDVNNLPVLIHNNFMVSNNYQIMKYLCHLYKREDLFGQTIRQKARLQQLINRYIVRQPQSMIIMFDFAELSLKMSVQEQFLQFQKMYETVMEESGYFKQFCDCTINSQTNYVLGQISLLDFVFLQSCNYVLGGFKRLLMFNQSMQIYCIKNGINRTQTKYIEYLDIMENYRSYLTGLPFYKENIDYLQSFSIISKKISHDKAEGLRKIWLGDPKLVR